MTKTFLISSHLDVVHIFHTLLFPTLHRCSSTAYIGVWIQFPSQKPMFAQIFLAVVFFQFSGRWVLATYLVNVKC